MRPEQKQSCETREFDSASAECEKEQSENIFTQAVGLRLVLLNAVLRVFFF
jgi:hypothetical protein